MSWKLVSASATTGAMARRARDRSVRREALGAAMLASVSTLVLLALICMYVSTDVLRLLAPSLALCRQRWRRRQQR